MSFKFFIRDSSERKQRESKENHDRILEEYRKQLEEKIENFNTVTANNDLKVQKFENSR